MDALQIYCPPSDVSTGVKCSIKKEVVSFTVIRSCWRECPLTSVQVPLSTEFSVMSSRVETVHVNV